MVGDVPLHPMVIHFPIALLIAGLGVDLAGILLKSEWLKRSALLLLILGALGSVAAVRSGSAQEEVILKTPAIEETLDTHEDSGKITMWFFLGLASARAGLTRLRKLTPAVHWTTLLFWAIGAGLLIRTAWYGGEMVYEHGAGVAAAAAPVGAARDPITGPAPPDRD